MRVALPYPRKAHPTTALGADYSSRRLIEHLRKHASHIEFDIFSVTGERVQTGVHGPQSSPQVGVIPSRWDLLHDVRPVGDPRRHFYLRSAQNKCFPIVQTHHALNYPFYLDEYFVPLLLARMQPYDAVICQSQASRQAFSALLDICVEALPVLGGRRPKFEGQLPIIPNGVDTDLFRPRDVKDIRHQLGVPASAFIILWVGRLSAATKADLLPFIRAYALLRDRNPRAEMLLVVVGTDRDGHGSNLEASAAALGLASSLRIQRTTPQSPIHLWYSAADVFVSPVDNVQETFGNSPIEAMASGVPQVVSDWDGYRDTVVHGETGFRVQTFWASCDDDAVAQWVMWGDAKGSQARLAQTVALDTGELVRYTEYLLRSPELRSKMAARSRRRALAEFAWPVVVSRYVECWSELVETSRHYTPPAPQPAGILPAFFRAFNGYASHVLTGESRVRVCPDAEGGTPVAKIGMGSESLFGRADLAERVVNGLERVLSALADGGGDLQLEELISTLAADDYSPTDVRRFVLGGIKYGLIEVCQENNLPQPKYSSF